MGCSPSSPVAGRPPKPAPELSADELVARKKVLSSVKLFIAMGDAEIETAELDGTRG